MKANDDLISRSALLDELQEELDFDTPMLDEEQNKLINTGLRIAVKDVKRQPAVDAVPVEVLGKWGKLILPYKGDPRGPVGRMGDAHLEEEALHWGVVTDADGGRWVPVYEAVLLELIEKAKERGVVHCCECEFHDTCKRVIEIIPRRGEIGSLGGHLHFCEYGKRRSDDGK